MLTEAESRALSIIQLRTAVEKETFGASHHFNYKKVGLSRAWFRDGAVEEAALPTPRAQAAYRFLMKHNRFIGISGILTKCGWTPVPP